MLSGFHAIQKEFPMLQRAATFLARHYTSSFGAESRALMPGLLHPCLLIRAYKSAVPKDALCTGK